MNTNKYSFKGPATVLTSCTLIGLILKSQYSICMFTGTVGAGSYRRARSIKCGYTPTRSLHHRTSQACSSRSEANLANGKRTSRHATPAADRSQLDHPQQSTVEKKENSDNSLSGQASLARLINELVEKLRHSERISIGKHQ